MRAWRNTFIRFGLVSVPVSLAPAVSEQELTASTYDRETGEKVKTAFTVDGATIAGETFRAYAGADGAPVEIERPEIAGAPGIELEAELELGAIDPLQYESTYCLWAGKGGASGFGLIAELLQGSARILAGRARFTDRPRSVILRWSPAAGCILLHTLYATERLRLEDMRKVAGELERPAPELLEQGEALLASLPTEWEPLERDAMQEALAAAIAGASSSSSSSDNAAGEELLEAMREELAGKSPSAPKKKSPKKSPSRTKARS